MLPVFIEKLSSRLQQRLPGKTAQNIMMVKPRLPFPNIDLDNQGTPAAVLILLYPLNKNWYFFLTKRTDTVDHHKGQVSFPGGMVEENESLKDAALRETHEEIGIPPFKIKLIGSLTSFYIPVSRFEIFPFIGWTEKKPKTSIHDQEVDSIFSPSIKDFMLDKTQKEKKDTLAGFPVKIPYFDLGGEIVWGATSIILSEFKSILKDIL